MGWLEKIRKIRGVDIIELYVCLHIIISVVTKVNNSKFLYVRSTEIYVPFKFQTRGRGERPSRMAIDAW